VDCVLPDQRGGLAMTPARIHDEVPAEPEDRLWGGKRWTALAAVVVLALIAAFAIAALLDGGGRGEAPAGQDSGSVSASAGGSVGLRPSPSAVPAVALVSAPAGVRWELVDGVALPFSAADGPARVAGGVASGFARTPAGALLACVQTGLRIGAVNPAGQAAEVRAMVVGAGKAGLLASRPATAPAVKPQLAGFRYVSYSADQAVIVLAERVTDVASNTARYVDVGELQLAWSTSAGDWRLVDDGSQPPLPTGLDASLTGYVPFAGA
jgi:hypothetical protein